MRMLLLLTIGLLALLVASFGVFRWRTAGMFPPVSTETVRLTPDQRTHLLSLRAEHKFEPHDYPPLGYTGTESPEEESKAVAGVDMVIDGVLAQPNGLVTAKATAALIGKAMRKVFLLPTEDRDRTGGYLIEIWYILGFKGATGRFAHGKGYPRPPGYAEPLPPGWSSPIEPRPIATPP